MVEPIDLAKILWDAEEATLVRSKKDAESHGVSLAQYEAQILKRERKNSRLEALKRFDAALSDEDVDAIAAGRIQDTSATLAVSAWWRSKRPLLVLCGGIGCGKTFAAACLAADIGGGKITPSSSLFRALRGIGQEPLNIRMGYSVFDDLGAEAISDHWRESFGEYMDVRHKRYRTLITTNLGAKALEARYGERIWDRLRTGDFVTITGKSMRKEGTRK